jgi:hypothetical protein
MTDLQYSVLLRNAKLDAIEVRLGTAPKMYIRTGAQPANCAAGDSGTVLATLTLPSDWMNAAASGSKTLLGTWEDTAADAAGDAAHFRIFDSGDSACEMQGDITATSGGGDIEVDNITFAIGQQFTITAFTITCGNA